MWKIFKILFNQIGQVPSQGTFSSQVDPRILDYFLGISKPATGLLGEGAFSALGADPTQFMQMSGLPAMAGSTDLFRINPAEAEQLGTAESKARENILQNTPMRGGELDTGLAQNTMHFGGLRNKLIEDRRNQALNALQGLSGFKIPPAQTSQQRTTGETTSTFDKLAALLGPTAIKSLIGPAANQLGGLLGLGSQPASGNLLQGTGWENMNLLAPVDTAPIPVFDPGLVDLFGGASFF